MLTELTITNFAIIERQTLSFHSGFNVISGETGAGKSIILNALEFILGGRVSPSVVRAGAEQAEVQALFDLTVVPAEVRQELPEVAHGEELVVSRTLPREGRGKVLINGRLGTLALLEEIVRRLVNICNQHHHTRLLDPRFHLELLDGFGTDAELLTRCKLLYRAWHSKRIDLDRVERDAEQVLNRREELTAQLEELGRLPSLKAGYRDFLEGEIRRRANAEKLITLGQQAAAVLNAEEGITQGLKSVSNLELEMARLDAGFEEMVEQLDKITAGLAEHEANLDRYLASIDLDSETLEQYRVELSELARLERRFRMNDEQLATLRIDFGRELDQLTDGNALAKLKREVERSYEVMSLVCQEIHKGRTAASHQLCRLVATDLHELNMREASLKVRFTEVEPNQFGTDRVEFLIATNPGEDHKPLNEIASGGELSRVMLVLKKILRERSGVNVLIFDEVDTGVSGGVARSVGRMLKEIAQRSQVICITHLPQVASLSDRHFLVNKQVGERAVTVVKELSDTEKVDEIARMLAGYTITDASRASARELIASNK